MPSPASANAITRSGATMTASRPPVSAPRKIVVNGGNLRIAESDHDEERHKQTRRVGWKTLLEGRHLFAGVEIAGLAEHKEDGEGNDQRQAGGDGGLANVLVEVDLRRRGGEIGRVRKRRGGVAEIGA